MILVHPVHPIYGVGSVGKERDEDALKCFVPAQVPPHSMSKVITTNYAIDVKFRRVGCHQTCKRVAVPSRGIVILNSIEPRRDLVCFEVCVENEFLHSSLIEKSQYLANEREQRIVHTCLK